MTDMSYAPLGWSGIQVSKVCLGGMSFGKALRNLGIPRDKVVLASKAYFNDGHLSRKAIEREIDGTLRRLGTDYLDLYIIHRFDYGTLAPTLKEGTR